MFKILLISFTLVFSANAQNSYESEWSDLTETFEYFYKGAYTQFTLKNNLYYTIPAVGTTYYSFEEDKRLSDNQRAKKLRKVYNVTGDVGIALNFPILPIGIYYLGQKNKDNHLIQFAKEYMATMYLTLAETGMISYIPGHERPNKVGQSMWETAFRGENSFPSGHIVPYSALFFKTLQFYGPYWAVIPGVLTYFSAMQRVREGRHYVSDVVGAFWLTAFAAEGVRAVASYKKNHPFYKMIFEREVQLTTIRYQHAYGPAIVYNY